MPNSFWHHFDCVCDERIAEIAFRSPKITNLVSKKGEIGWHREAKQFFLGTRRRGARMCQQQQHGSSSAAARQQQQKQQRRRWWRWRRRRRRRRQHGKPFFTQLSQQHRSPQNMIMSTTSGETLNTTRYFEVPGIYML